MSWFSNLFSNEVVSLAVSDQGLAKPEPYDMVRAKINSGAVSQQISIISNLVMGLPISNKDRTKYLRSGISVTTSYGKGRSWPHREKLTNLLSLLSTSIADIDVQRSDMKTLFHLIDLCNSTLPAMSRDLEIKIGQKDWSEEYRILADMATAISTMLDEIATLPTRRSILNLEIVSNNPKTKDFPNIDDYKENEELYSSLEKLKQDWDKASELPLSAEDDYVVERVGNSYLPDALLLFDRFSNRTGSANNQKALSIVKEQVKLIHQQVLFVLEQHEEDSFDLMETHTEFLKMKNSRMGLNESIEDTGLQLEKDSPETSL
jgi:hypothetical protein